MAVLGNEQRARNVDYSGNGNTFAQDYSNNIAPTVFIYTGLEVTNHYVNTSSTAVQLEVAGSPYYVATLIDDTNFADAVWNRYAGTSATVNLGLTEGWHDVWIGLRGHEDDPTNAIWQWQHVKLDYTPPALVISGPTNGTVDVTVIQLTGYSPEALSRISYDLTNAAGTVTNQPVLVEGQDYSTNTYEFTTSYFQAYDVPLTNGVNALTIHATDMAGNVATLVTNFTLDYSAKTNPPVVQLLWPQDGMEIVGSNLVCRGSVSDPTAAVTVQLVDANGNTNTVGSLVGRDGLFYAGSLTLAAGTNYLSYTATDSAGNVATTNIAVSTSTLGLTLNPVVAGQALVTGTIDDTNYTVYVNGVQATNNGDGTWSVTITPICVGGGAVVVNAIKNAGDPSLQQIVDAPSGVFVSAYHKHESADVFDWMQFWDGGLIMNDDLDWQDGLGGDETRLGENYGWLVWPNYGFSTNLMECVWPANNWPQALPMGIGTWAYSNIPGNDSTNIISPVGLPQEHRDTIQDYYSVINGEVSPTNPIKDRVRQTADTEMKLATGGPSGSRQMNLWCITASATGYTNDADGNSVGYAIPPEQIEIGSYGHLDTNGELWLALPDNDPDVVTPHVNGKSKYTFSVNGTKYTLKHTTYYPALTNTNRARTTIGVGEEVSFSFQPTMPYALDWTTTAGGLSDAFSSSTTLTASSNAVSGLTVTAKVRAGASVTSPPFTVLEPSGIDHALIIGTNHYSVGDAGVGMTTSAYIAPTSVSFYKVNIMEVGEDATNITGYFTQWTPQQLHHNTADYWSPLNSNNQFTDEAYHFGYSAPWSSGTFTWDIPARWQIIGSNVTNAMNGWSQNVSIDASGTMTVQKFGHTMTRTTNDVITAQ